MKDGKFEAEDIYLLLYDRFSDGNQWLCAREVGNCTGGGRRRLDFVAANCYNGDGLGIYAFEVKVSKSDLRRELTIPEKHTLFFPEVDYYSIVAPDYVLDKEYCDLVPKNWGIYRAIDGKGLKPNLLRAFRKPIALHDEHTRTLSRGFAFELMRCMKSNGEFCNSKEKDEMLRAQYDLGFQKGRQSIIKCGQDYEKLYEEQRSKFLDALSAMRLLGVDCYSFGYKKNQYTENARRIADENDACKSIVDRIRGYQWDSKGIHRLIDMIDAAVAPLQEIVKSEKEPTPKPSQEVIGIE